MNWESIIKTALYVGGGTAVLCFAINTIARLLMWYIRIKAKMWEFRLVHYPLSSLSDSEFIEFMNKKLEE